MCKKKGNVNGNFYVNIVVILIYKWWFPFWFTNIKNNNNKRSLLKVIIIILCIWQENVQMCHPLFDDDDDDYYHNDYMNDKNCYDNHSGVANTIDTCSIWFYFDLPIFFPVSGCCWFIFFFHRFAWLVFNVIRQSFNHLINWSIFTPYSFMYEWTFSIWSFRWCRICLIIGSTYITKKDLKHTLEWMNIHACFLLSCWLEPD